MEYTFNPCQPYITRSLDVFNQERVLEAAKCFANTFKNQGYDSHISYSLLNSLSQTVAIGKPSPDFFLIEDISYTDMSYFEKLFGQQQKPLSCGALYSRLDKRKQLCSLCPLRVSQTVYEQRRKDELTLLSYLITAKDNLELLNGYDIDKIFQIKIDLLQDYTDVDMPLVIPLYRQIIKQYINNNVMDFYESMQLNPVTYLRDALSICLKHKNVPTGCLRHTFTTLSNELNSCQKLGPKEADVLLQKLEENMYKETKKEEKNKTKQVTPAPPADKKKIPEKGNENEIKEEKKVILLDPFQMSEKITDSNSKENVRTSQTSKNSKREKKVTFTQETLYDILDKTNEYVDEKSNTPEPSATNNETLSTDLEDPVITNNKHKDISNENTTETETNIIYLPVPIVQEPQKVNRDTEQDITITDNIIDGTKSYVKDSHTIEDYLYNPIIPKKWLEEECICLDTTPLLSAYETYIYKDKYVILDAFLDDENHFLFLMYYRYKNICFYSYLENEMIRNVLSSILSHKSIRKICVNPYMIYGTAALYSFQVRNVFSIQLAYKILLDCPGTIDNIFQYFCNKPKELYHFDAAAYLPLYFLAYRNSLKQLAEKKKQYVFKKAQMLQEAYGYSYVNRYLTGKNILFRENHNGHLIYENLNNETRSTVQGYFCTLHLETTSSYSIKELMEECLMTLAEEGRFRNIPFQLVDIQTNCMTFFIEEDYCDKVVSLLHIELFELASDRHLERFSIRENTRATNLVVYK